MTRPTRAALLLAADAVQEQALAQDGAAMRCDDLGDNASANWYRRAAAVLRRAESDLRARAAAAPELESESAVDLPAVKDALRNLLAINTPWPLESVLERLIAAGEHLLDYHACDEHGHEGVRYALIAATDLKREASKAALALYYSADTPPPVERSAAVERLIAILRGAVVHFEIKGDVHERLRDALADVDAERRGAT